MVETLLSKWRGAPGPGCAVAVSHRGRTDFASAAGTANLEHGVALSPTSIFHAASLAKQFTAFSIHLLAEEKRLSLNDDIRKHLPDIPDYGSQISIRHLIHHTSGLREQGQLLFLSGWRGDDVMTQEDMLRVIMAQKSLNFEPGSEIGYVNAGYTLLAEIVKRVSGKSLRSFADERIFRPLGMSNTHFRDDRTELVPGRAVGYRPQDGGWRISVPAFDHHGSTNLSTSVGDLMMWQQNLLTGQVGGLKAVQAMQRSGMLNDGSATGYGGGLFLDRYRGMRVVSHDGADHGYRADIITFPDQHIAIAALCNGSSLSATDLTRSVASIYLGDRLETTSWTPRARPKAELSKLAGVYWSPLTDEIVQVELREGALRRRGDQRPLIPLADGSFGIRDTPDRWSFKGRSARQTLSIRDYWPTPRWFERLPPYVPETADFLKYVGRYRSDELKADFEVRFINGHLALHFGRGVTSLLEPVGEFRFVSSMLGTISFQNSSSGHVEALTISNRRLRRFSAARVK